MKKPQVSLLGPLICVAVVYVGLYLAFRAAHGETWDRDGRTYVIYPADRLGFFAYRAFRPMAYLDARYMDVQSHIGPHLEPAPANDGPVI